MKIALFAAVKEEVMNICDRVHLCGIGRENATNAMLQFLQQHQNEDFTIMNIGTAGAHTAPVGSLVRVTEIVSGGAAFIDYPMLLDRLPVETPEAADGKLFSSDCFVSPRVYSTEFLQGLREKADCFDMESSALYTVAKHFGIPYVSFKIVSDHLDVDLTTWQQRVHDFSPTLCEFAMKTIEEIGKIEPVTII